MKKRYRFDPHVPPAEVAAWAPHLAAAGYRPTEGDDWTLYWARALPPAGVYERLAPGRRVNRVPGIGALALKDSLLANVRSAHWWSAGDDLFDFHPETYFVPQETERLRVAASRDREAVWILKRRAATRGRGMRLLAGLDELPRDGSWLVQRYVERPHLLDGHKYGLRFYLALTSLDPLVCLVHEVGTCRFASRRYSLAPGSFEDPVVHLTNTEVQASNAKKPWWARDTDLAGYRRLLRATGIDVEGLFDRIRTALVGMILACREQILIESRARTDHLAGCFDFLGVDVQIDEEMKPWILEANAGPPMELEPYPDGQTAALSLAIKNTLIGDLLALLEGEPRGWRPLWPGPDADRYVHGFPLLRPADRERAALICPAVDQREENPRPAPAVETWPLGETLALYEPRRGRLHVLNRTAAVVWLGLADGLDATAVAAELVALYPRTARRRIEADVWDLLVAWAQAGLLAGYEPASRRCRYGPWIVPAVLRGEELVVSVDGAKLSAWGEALPTSLPAIIARRLTLVLPAVGGAAGDAEACTPAVALEALGRALDGQAIDPRTAAAAVAWLDSLDHLTVVTASGRLG